MADHGAMKAYSEDLRQKVVEAVEQRGTSKSEAARRFSISLSSVKRYTKLASRGEPLAPGREAEDLPKQTSSQESSSRTIYAQDQPPPLKRGAASLCASPARTSASPP
jgi:transposase